MKTTKILMLFASLLISTIGYTSEVIPPGSLLEIIANNNDTIKKLKTNWVIENSELIKNSSKKELERALELLKNIDNSSIKNNLWEDKIQKVKTKNGLNFEVKFSYTKYDYGPNDIMLSGAYSLVSVEIIKTVRKVDNPVIKITTGLHEEWEINFFKKNYKNVVKTPLGISMKNVDSERKEKITLSIGEYLEYPDHHSYRKITVKETGKKGVTFEYIHDFNHRSFRSNLIEKDTGTFIVKWAE